MLKAHSHEKHHEQDHGHDHSHDHGLRQVPDGGKKDILIALSITFLMMVAEVVGGLLANSLALLSDAGHMLTDNLALLLSFFAMTFASLPATERRTYGFYRLEILAAFVNGIVLVLISLFIMYHAYLRMVHPQPVQGILMLVVAAVGLVANIIGAFFLHKHSKTSLNVRGAYLHIVGDALSSIGVVIGGIIIIFTGWYLIDPILSIMIALVIIYGAWSLVKESVNILLESAPAHLAVETIAEALGEIEGVREAYHIHLWTITSGVYALSACVVIDDQLVSKSRDVLNEIRSLLSEKFNILHNTIQLECEKCDMSPACSLPDAHRNNRRHDDRPH